MVQVLTQFIELKVPFSSIIDYYDPLLYVVYLFAYHNCKVSSFGIIHLGVCRCKIVVFLYLNCLL